MVQHKTAMSTEVMNQHSEENVMKNFWKHSKESKDLVPWAFVENVLDKEPDTMI